MLKISSLIREDREFLSAMDTLGEGLRREKPLPIVINGLSGGATLAFVSEAVSHALSVSSGSVVVFASTEEERSRLASYLSADGIPTAEYKGREPVLHNISASHDVERERLSVLSRLSHGGLRVVVTTPSAALSLTMPPEILSSLSLSLAVGDEISPDTLAARLTALGFNNVDSVEGRGQFARRGGIVDFYGADMDFAVRCEFFGDEIDRLSSFDTGSQRTLENIDGVFCSPHARLLWIPTLASVFFRKSIDFCPPLKFRRIFAPVFFAKGRRSTRLAVWSSATNTFRLFTGRQVFSPILKKDAPSSFSAPRIAAMK